MPNVPSAMSSVTMYSPNFEAGYIVNGEEDMMSREEGFASAERSEIWWEKGTELNKYLGNGIASYLICYSLRHRLRHGSFHNLH